MAKASEAGGQLVPDPQILFMAHVMFVLQEKEKKGRRAKGEKSIKSRMVVTYRATRFTFG